MKNPFGSNEVERSGRLKKGARATLTYTGVVTRIFRQGGTAPDLVEFQIDYGPTQLAFRSQVKRSKLQAPRMG